MIKGPFSRSASSPLKLVSKTWYTQSRPRLERLPYDMREAHPTTKILGGLNRADNSFPPSAFGSTAPAMDKCYDKLKEKIGAASQMAVNLLERQQALDMISARAVSILQSARRIRRGDFRGLIPKGVIKRKGREKRFSPKGTTKNLSDSWLEYHFGWEPLIGDIGAAVEILQGGVPPVTCKARASYKNVSLQGNPGYYWTLWINDYQAKVQMITEVSVSDPNLWLANQLGFVNPLVIAWELVPFSFVVDWFTNVGSFLSQYSDFYGLSLSRPATTTLETVSRTWSNWRDEYCGIDSVQMRRVAGITKPPLLIRPRKRLSITRAATAVALLNGFLK